MHYKHPEDNYYQTKIGFITFMKEAVKLGSSIARIPSVLLYVRAIQEHTGGEMIATELMGHVAIPYKWTEFMERILLSSRMFVQCAIDPQVRTHCWRTRKYIR